MLSLEQVKLLETKVAKAIEYVERADAENAALQSKLDSYQKRIDELEVVVLRFKEDQGRIEDGILSALDRLNRFEAAVEKSLKEKAADQKAVAEKAASAAAPKPEKSTPLQAAELQTADHPNGKAKSSEKADGAEAETETKPGADSKSAEKKEDASASMFFEIPEAEVDDDIADPLDGADGKDGGEFEIF